MRRVGLLVGAAGAVAGAGILLVTPDGSGIWQPLDDAARGLIAPHGWHGGHVVVTVASLLVAAVVMASVLRRLDRDRRARAMASVAAAAGLAAVVAWLVADGVHRPGPSQPIDVDAALRDHSFPSLVGAVTVAAMLRVGLAAAMPRPRVVRLVAAVAVPMIALRIATDTAWLTDEIAGGVLGVVAVACVAPVQPVPIVRRSRWTRGQLTTRALIALLLVAMATWVGTSYASFLAAPGSAPISDRTVEYLRDHGLSGVVDRAESWWLWTHPPSTSGRLAALPSAPLAVSTTPTAAAPTTTTTTNTTVAPPGAGTVVAPTTTAPPPAPVGGELPPPIAPVLADPLPGEGAWTVAAADAAGAVQVATTTYRPDADHPTLVAAVAWINQTTTRLSLIAGLREPGGGAGPAGAQIPRTAVPTSSRRSTPATG